MVKSVARTSKSVPPTATLKGVDASPLTWRPPCACCWVSKSSQPADPASPAATVTVMPCEAACSQKLLMSWFPVVPWKASHPVKLTFRMLTALSSTARLMARKRPESRLVSAAVYKVSVAPGARPPETSRSSRASTTSPLTPGSLPSTTTVGVAAGSPKRLR